MMYAHERSEGWRPDPELSLSTFMAKEGGIAIQRFRTRIRGNGGFEEDTNTEKSDKIYFNLCRAGMVYKIAY